MASGATGGNRRTNSSRLPPRCYEATKQFIPASLAPQKTPDANGLSKQVYSFWPFNEFVRPCDVVSQKSLRFSTSTLRSSLSAPDSSFTGANPACACLSRNRSIRVFVLVPTPSLTNTFHRRYVRPSWRPPLSLLGVVANNLLVFAGARNLRCLGDASEVRSPTFPGDSRAGTKL
jgi:hypothetical protein